MGKRLKVTSIQHEDNGDQQLLKADFASPVSQLNVWFRVGKGAINISAEPFLPIALIPAMRRHWAVILDGGVSARLAQGVDAIQGVMSSWFRKFRRVEVRVTGTVEAENTLHSNSVAAFFSGGVDSFFTLLRHKNELTHLVFVHGFDLPLEAVKLRERMAANARQVARQFGLELVEVETNLRDFGDPHVSWPEAYFGAGLAAVGLLLSPRFARIYIPASVSEDQLIPLGSHPDLDHHWSNGEIEISHDGVEFDRTAKIRAIAELQPVKNHLRVCYQLVQSGLNCGRCRKCLWTMLVLESIGCLHSVDTFPNEIHLDSLRLYLPTDKHQQDRFRMALESLEKRGVNPELRKVLHEVLREGEREAAKLNSRLKRSRLKRLSRKIRKWIARNETS